MLWNIDIYQTLIKENKTHHEHLYSIVGAMIRDAVPASPALKIVEIINPTDMKPLLGMVPYQVLFNTDNVTIDGTCFVGEELIAYLWIIGPHKEIPNDTK